MNEQRVVLLCMGSAFLLIGCLLALNERFAAWSLSFGRAKIWVKIFGQERATALTRYGFGPLCILLGLFGVVAGVLGK